MGKTNTGLSELVALGGALLASRRVRFWAAVLATALVGVTLSTGSARAQNTCDSYYDREVAAPSGSDEETRYRALWRACQWGGVNRAEEIRQTGACLSDYRKYWEAPSGSDEESRYRGLWRACVLGGENRAEEIRQTGACLSDFRRARKAPSGSDERSRYYGLFSACVLGGENRAEEIRQTGACLSDYRRIWEADGGSDERLRRVNAFKACLREINPTAAAPATPAPQPAAAATPAPRQETVAASFDVQAFETIVDKMVAAMKEELGETTRPTLVIVPIESRLGENIDTQLINESVRIRLSELRFFRVVNRNLETIMKEVQLAQSGLADSETAVEIGRLVGAQYVLYGTVANISGNQQTNYRIVLALIEIETGFETFVGAARVRK